MHRPPPLVPLCGSLAALLAWIGYGASLLSLLIGAGSERLVLVQWGAASAVAHAALFVGLRAARIPARSTLWMVANVLSAALAVAVPWALLSLLVYVGSSTCVDLDIRLTSASRLIGLAGVWAIAAAGWIAVARGRYVLAAIAFAVAVWRFDGAAPYVRIRPPGPDDRGSVDLCTSFDRCHRVAENPCGLGAGAFRIASDGATIRLIPDRGADTDVAAPWWGAWEAAGGRYDCPDP